MAEAEAAKLPIIDLCSSDSISTANSIRQACVDYGFFYLVNHGVEEELLARVFEESRKFFSLPLAAKMNLLRKENRGYAPFYAENLDPSSRSKGDSKESFHIGPLEKSCLNQWPSQELLPSWRPTMESYYCKVLCYLRSAGKRLISLIALALNLDKDYFEKIGALDKPESFLRVLHYPAETFVISGELGNSEEEIFGASAHSDYGMITLLVTDGVPGLQVCREKFNEPRTWENVIHRNGAFIVNIGDMMERWTNCLFRSTLHRVMPTGQERYSLAFFLEPNVECIVQCLESCCSESSPPRFAPIRSGDYLKERFRLTYGS
ncbi:2-oxoglutarate-Fe(II) type oxidoreductase hxnY isoform X2 [Manihot esculenta]|uniref:2-oxoglutarate-Fe(II) type oxidoreductase hxnY isoform X2 n=1 Tax=Manihot esculenta TaxID=3983 RepID=UPI001CC57546|nr:2-oxoglutarate-Fe(II) type oxidoreductase hxnY isoform X2 [Manihot esculenta]